MKTCEAAEPQIVAGQVPEVLCDLESELAIAEGLAQSYETRLLEVLRPQSPASVEEDEKCEVEMVPLAHRIRAIRRALEAINNRLRDTLRRIEL